MSRAAVKLYVGRIAAQLQDPTPFDVFTQLPKEDEVGQRSVAVVTISQSEERRKALGYVTGLKEVIHSVQVDFVMVHDDSQVGGRLFDSALEKFDQLVRGAAKLLPAELVDPDTGVGSSVKLMDDVGTHVQDPRMDSSVAGLVFFMAAKVVTVVEEVFG